MTISVNRRHLLAGAGAFGLTLPTIGAGMAQQPDPDTPQASPANNGSRPSGSQPVTEIASGRIRGTERGGILSFKGIPYGASTGGANRFRPPQPVDPWEGVRDTIVYGYQCPWDLTTPTNSGFAPEDAFLLYREYTPHIAGEDCLRVNVWTPSTTGRRPILVYMHGGAYAAGSGNDLLTYDGENLARRGDAVVITHNHRLNILGYLDLSHFGGEWKRSVNLGMQDIEALLRWVQTNAGAFGGDPDNVTIFGQSGGGGKVQALLAMPSTKGLFHKAIVQSGAFGGALGSISPKRARELTGTTLELLGIDPDNLAGLRDVPIAELSRAAVAAGFIAWQPVVDGSIIAGPIGTPETLRAEVPLIVGSVLNELTNAVDNPKSLNYGEDALIADCAAEFGEAGAAIAAAYREQYPDRTDFELWAAIQTASVRDASWALADAQRSIGGAAYQYLFTWATPMLEGRPKTFHSAEIAFVFDNAGLCVNQTGGGPEALVLSGQVSDAWIAFARTGSPDHAGLPDWPEFGETRQTMVFDVSSAVVQDPEGVGRALIRSTRS